MPLEETTGDGLPAPSTPLRYRPDVDGLRAVAVLAVVAAHAHLPLLSGGFVGVDVFFVISGYLISAIIMRDIDAGRFSIVGFYERRIRRIFPAMLAMFFVVSLVSMWLLIPRELIGFAKSLLAALASGSNFLFWHDVDYFDNDAIYKPLIHTWSLAVEEQFYLLFPPFLLLLRRFWPNKVKPTIFVLAGVSLIAAALVLPRYPAAAFYFTPLRMWELLFGTILSQRYLPALRGAAARNVASGAGILLILVPVVLYSEGTPFPGFSALPPCLGASLIIAAGESGSSLVGRILSWRPVVFVGLISYSLYLWHWPVMVFQATNYLLVPYRYNGRHVTAPNTILVSFLLAILSWAFIEQPFRVGRLRFPRRVLFRTAAWSVGGMFLAGLTILLTGGLPSRYSPAAQAVASHMDWEPKEHWRSGQCFIGPTVPFRRFQKDACLDPGPLRPSLLLLGDSHAASLYPGLTTVLPEMDILQANASGCRVLLHEPASQTTNCKQLSAFLFTEFLPRHHVDLIVFAGRWRQSEYKALGDTLAWTRSRGFTSIVLGNNPESDAPMPRLIANQLRGKSSEPPSSHYIASLFRADHEMAKLAEVQWHVPYVSFYDAYCKPDCPAYAAPLVPLNTDGTHLTIEGGEMFVSALRAKLISLDKLKAQTPSTVAGAGSGGDAAVGPR